MSQNINTVDISNDANLEDYVLVSVNGSLRRVKVANLKELVDSTEDVVVVDTELSTTSVNPVQNKVITTELNKKANSSDMSTYQTKRDNTLTTTSKEVVGAINENTTSINQLSSGKSDKSEVSELKEDLGYLDNRTSKIENDLLGGAIHYEEMTTYNTLNRFDYTKIEDGLIDSETGIVYSSVANRYTSDYIQVANLEYMRVCYWNSETNSRKNQAAYSICFFDKEKNVISGEYNKTTLQIISETVKYIRVSLSDKSLAPLTMILIREQANPNATEYIGYDAITEIVPVGGGAETIIDRVTELENNVETIKPTTNIPKVYVFGDSISAGDYYDENNVNPQATSWTDTLKEYRPWAWCEQLDGCTVVNKSIANTGYIKANRLSQTIPSAVSNAITDGITDANLIIFAGGINDYKSNLILGDVENIPSLGTDTVLGSMINCIRLLQAESPLAQFIICSPINCKAKGNVETQYSINFKNSASTPYTLLEMAEGFKKVCEYLRISFVDMTSESSVSMLNIDTILGADKIHPSVDGLLPIARSYKAKIQSAWSPIVTVLPTV